MAKTISIILGVVFLLIGILGMVGTSIVGPEGAFMTNTLHDIVHLVSGIIFLVVAFASPKSASMTMKVFGIVYLLVAILGFVAPGLTSALLMGNAADNWLHVVFAVVIFGLGWYTAEKPAVPMSSQMSA